MNELLFSKFDDIINFSDYSKCFRIAFYTHIKTKSKVQRNHKYLFDMSTTRFLLEMKSLYLMLISH